MGHPVKRPKRQQRSSLQRQSFGFSPWSHTPAETKSEREAKAAAMQRFFAAGGQVRKLPCLYRPLP